MRDTALAAEAGRSHEHRRRWQQEKEAAQEEGRAIAKVGWHGGGARERRSCRPGGGGVPTVPKQTRHGAWANGVGGQRRLASNGADLLHHVCDSGLDSTVAAPERSSGSVRVS